MTRPKGALNKTTYTKMDKALELIHDGATVSAACKKAKLTRKTLYRLVKERDDYAALFELARDVGYDAMADDCIKIADGATEKSAKSRKLRVDTRIRLLGRWTNRYSNKEQVEHTGTVSIAALLRERRERADADRE